MLYHRTTEFIAAGPRPQQHWPHMQAKVRSALSCKWTEGKCPSPVPYSWGSRLTLSPHAAMQCNVQPRSAPHAALPCDCSIDGHHRLPLTALPQLYACRKDQPYQISSYNAYTSPTQSTTNAIYLGNGHHGHPQSTRTAGLQCPAQPQSTRTAGLQCPAQPQSTRTAGLQCPAQPHGCPVLPPHQQAHPSKRTPSSKVHLGRYLTRYPKGTYGYGCWLHQLVQNKVRTGGGSGAQCKGACWPDFFNMQSIK
jgi:hypothetical protein